MFAKGLFGYLEIRKISVSLCAVQKRAPRVDRLKAGISRLPSFIRVLIVVEYAATAIRY